MWEKIEMSVDKEMIEEMAKELKDMANRVRTILEQRTDIGYIPDLAFPVAKELLKHYQPKLPKDSVVQPTVQSYSTHDSDLMMLSRKEYEKLNMKYISALEQLEKKDKETAEKILKWLKKSCTFFGFDFVETYFKEQFGVEIKE